MYRPSDCSVAVMWKTVSPPVLQTPRYPSWLYVPLDSRRQAIVRPGDLVPEIDRGSPPRQGNRKRLDEPPHIFRSNYRLILPAIIPLGPSASSGRLSQGAHVPSVPCTESRLPYLCQQEIASRLQDSHEIIFACPSQARLHDQMLRRLSPRKCRCHFPGIPRKCRGGRRGLPYPYGVPAVPTMASDDQSTGVHSIS